MTARFWQFLIAVPFVTLGGWALVWPSSVQWVAFRPEVQMDARILNVALGAFGAQALLCALFILTSRFTRWSFLAYAIALLPFFAFNYWFLYVEPLFSAGMIIDFAANLAMLGFCFMGWRAAKAEGL
ncbi:hypothetical protein [Maritimibacter sp. DP1N21-5]|uniref:hypothetical protein n=1 Tax=Maritimibacter sp. DP1N21-5 TaxID=2836867 RepID=UPI001C461B6E|nr:hypothetical protein [Maritimibacter sp. DP1N21-5]MBV7410247.1 hypothetical protein [Maritimibacter sp. DP1N21-5]